MRLLALLSLMLFVASCGEEPMEAVKKIRPIKYATIASSTGMETHTFSGVAKAQNETNLSFKVAGTLSSINVELGDRVRKGQLIATIDPADYNIQTKQAISQKEGSVANAKAAETQLINAQATYDRVAKLYENNSVSLSEYQQAKAGLDAAQAQYEAANSQVSAADQQVQAADNQVSYARLISPMNGVVTAVQVEANEIVNSGTVVAQISSLGRPEVEVGVPEIFINKIKKGQQVKITLPSSPGQEFQGVVDQVAYASGTAPTYPVIVETGQSVEQIRPGMAANVAFLFPKNGDAAGAKMIVPVEAVGKEKQGNFVFVLKQKREGIYEAEKKVITIGPLTPEGFELLSGLAKGDIVATAGLTSLMNGVEVKLLNY
ncbi:MAG: efflux RND transporter periplasmic adaptor subunit [Saprospiraceae bacterium]|nr:efflux RND transporter periplasmic adaptor subunit [Saprospiraceae bacterium]